MTLLGTSILETSSPVGLARPLPAINAKFNSALQDITKQIALLRKFSLIILSMGRETQDPQAISDFKVTDDKGHDLEPTLKDDFALYIRNQFPGVSKVNSTTSHQHHDFAIQKSSLSEISLR